MKKLEATIASNGKTYAALREVDGFQTLTDDRGTWSMHWGVIERVGEKLEKGQDGYDDLFAAFATMRTEFDAMEKQIEAESLRKALAAKPTESQIADEAHARRWAAATNDPSGNY